MTPTGRELHSASKDLDQKLASSTLLTKVILKLHRVIFFTLISSFDSWSLNELLFKLFKGAFIEILERDAQRLSLSMEEHEIVLEYA